MDGGNIIDRLLRGVGLKDTQIGQIRSEIDAYMPTERGTVDYPQEEIDLFNPASSSWDQVGGRLVAMPDQPPPPPPPSGEDSSEEDAGGSEYSPEQEAADLEREAEVYNLALTKANMLSPEDENSNAYVGAMLAEDRSRGQSGPEGVKVEQDPFYQERGKGLLESRPQGGWSSLEEIPPGLRKALLEMAEQELGATPPQGRSP